jgi:serine/threonine protein phosphatase PrpC
MGDKVAITYGCSYEPEINHLKINENDKMIVIASDGVWETVSN